MIGTKVSFTSPRDAAGLVLLREAAGQIEVLLGCRHRRMVFMPGLYVFPGGRLEESDKAVGDDMSPEAVPPGLDSGTVALLPALRSAALRELREETGLHLNAATARLRLVARAITPPGNPRRYDTRFFLGDGAQVSGEIGGDGELSDVGWRSLLRLTSLPMPRITEVVLEQALKGWRDPEACYREITDPEELG